MHFLSLLKGKEGRAMAQAIGREFGTTEVWDLF